MGKKVRCYHATREVIDTVKNEKHTILVYGELVQTNEAKGFLLAPVTYNKINHREIRSIDDRYVVLSRNQDRRPTRQFNFGWAICDANDEFDLATGIKIAKRRFSDSPMTTTDVRFFSDDMIRSILENELDFIERNLEVKYLPDEHEPVKIHHTIIDGNGNIETEEETVNSRTKIGRKCPTIKRNKVENEECETHNATCEGKAITGMGNSSDRLKSIVEEVVANELRITGMGNSRDRLKSIVEEVVSDELRKTPCDKIEIDEHLEDKYLPDDYQNGCDGECESCQRQTCQRYDSKGSVEPEDETYDESKEIELETEEFPTVEFEVHTEQRTLKHGDFVKFTNGYAFMYGVVRDSGMGKDSKSPYVNLYWKLTKVDDGWVFRTNETIDTREIQFLTPRDYEDDLTYKILYEVFGVIWDKERKSLKLKSF